MNKKLKNIKSNTSYKELREMTEKNVALNCLSMMQGNKKEGGLTKITLANRHKILASSSSSVGTIKISWKTTVE